MLRVAMFTPLPPARTGTADYATQLVHHLQNLVRVQVFEEARRINPKDFDALIYHIANNPYHAEFYERALEMPGITVLHEVNLHDLIKTQTLNSERAYLGEVIHEIYGHDLREPHRVSALEVPQPRVFTMLRRLLDHSECCIVHSRYAERIVRQKGFQGPVAVIPHGSSVRKLDPVPYRRRLGVESKAPLIGLFGFHRPDKREFECFRAFQGLLSSYPNAHLLIAGVPHPEIPVKRWVTESGLQKQVHIVGFQSIEDFDRSLNACDLVLNLRHPTFGETSGTMMRAFGLGKVVLVSDTGASSEVPDDVCVHIPPDDYEERVLVESMHWLLDRPSLMDEIGQRAQQWVRNSCDWPDVAQMYAAVAAGAANRKATDSMGASPQPRATPKITHVMDTRAVETYLRRWIDPASEAAAYFSTHQPRLIRTLQRTPPGNEGGCILEMGCYLQITPALRDLLEYSEVRGSYFGKSGEAMKATVTAIDGEIFECFIDLFNAEVDRFPYPDGYFSTVLCCELLEHLERDPMHMMAEIHRILKPEGVLVLTTPNIASLVSIGNLLKGAHPSFFRRYSRPKTSGEIEPGHSREYTPDEIRLLLADSGFIPVTVETAPYGETQAESLQWVVRVLRESKLPTVLREQCIFALGRKESLPKKRFPVWLYGE
jgi:glycosyltransferase involved in cell wall biosynthesis/SAM-dependent methyltransferase